MRNLHFYYLAARNFRCFGPQGIELNLNNYGNIILIKGENLDRAKEFNADESKARNGVGKTTIPELIVYGLFGKPIKITRSQDSVINNKIGKDLYVEVRWEKYRVVRTRKENGKTNNLQLWESTDHIWDVDSEITLGGMPATQRKIEEIIGLNYQTFVNTIFFTDKNKDAFLECDTPNKRKIVENLLSLETYAEYHQTAKDIRKSHKDKVDLMVKQYERMLVELDSSKKRVEQAKDQEITWKTSRKAELSSIVTKYKAKQAQLANTDQGADLLKYNEAQEKIQKLNESLLVNQSYLEKIKSLISEVTQKMEISRDAKKVVSERISSLEMTIITSKKRIQLEQEVISRFESKAGLQCPTCLGTVEEKNYSGVVTHAKETISTQKTILLESEPLLAQAKKRSEEILQEYRGYESTIKAAEKKASEFNTQMVQSRREIQELSKIPLPQATTDQRLLEEQLDQLKQQAIAKKLEMDGVSPYAEIIKSSVEEVENKSIECSEKKSELILIEAELPYYDFWLKAFGDAGIRKFVIDGIIPALNSRVAYWLQFLIDGKVKLTFDNELNETIQNEPSDGEPFVYEVMSGGEQRRLNLAVSQAFAYVQMLNAAATSNVVFLDEVTSNVDPLGVEGIYRMISELAKTKKVFVTTHDRDLLDILAGCQTIHLVKKDGFTTLV